MSKTNTPKRTQAQRGEVFSTRLELATPLALQLAQQCAIEKRTRRAIIERALAQYFALANAGVYSAPVSAPSAD